MRCRLCGLAIWYDYQTINEVEEELGNPNVGYWRTASDDDTCCNAAAEQDIYNAGGQSLHEPEETQ